MSENAHKELMKSEFCESYLEKLYYFCLKKTGDSYEAEDLSQDISLNILEAIEKGTVPMHFSAWVWQIARNRYSVWAAKKRSRATAVSGAAADELEIADEYTIEGEYIHSEEMASLRRELAFISAEYRDIVVAYYIQDRKAKDIAHSLGIPEGTVKTRLFRARNILKEGMNMAREFGVRSYKPEDVSFVASGDVREGRPWRLVERKIAKNIVLEASNNPSTAEELSIELGIALPYMEEEIKILEEATLLRKLDGGKYITDFYIMDRDSQMSIWLCMNESKSKIARLIDKICEDSIDKIRDTIYVPRNMSDNDLKWWVVIALSDIVSQDMPKCDLEIKPRSNGECWDFRGYEISDVPDDIFVGMNGCGSTDVKAQFWAYKIKKYGMWDRAGEMNVAQVGLLADCIRSNRKISSLTASEQVIWKEIEGRFAHEEDGCIVPDILVMNDNDDGCYYIDGILKSHGSYGELYAAVSELFDKIENILRKNSAPIWHGSLAKHVSSEFFKLRMLTIIDEVESGRLTVPADPEHSTIAMWLSV